MGVNMGMPKPLNEVWGVVNPITVRAIAALPGGGAYDAAPTPFSVASLSYVTLYFQYIRGGAGGSFGFRIDISPFSADQLVFENWYRTALYQAGVLAAGADVASAIQREAITYQATAGAAIETFVYGPIEILGTVERIRIACAEIGAVATPGTCGIVAVMV
jgi:hypothetical protein